MTADNGTYDKPRLLDLFCGAGGAAVGYHRAGFDVVGVDIAPQPRYPFEFHQGDAMTWPLAGYDAIHASPPCQLWSEATRTGDGRVHHDLLTPIRARLLTADIPYVIENVPKAPLIAPIVLCGSMFDLDVRRHRCFEANWGLRDHHWPCRHRIWARRFRPNNSVRRRHGGRLAFVVDVTGGGSGGYGGRVADWRAAMGIDWMTRDELTQAIPPAYTEYIGAQLIDAIRAAA